MSYQTVRVTRIEKTFSFCLSVKNFRQRLKEAETGISSHIPPATFFLRDVVDANDRKKHAKMPLVVTGEFELNRDKSGVVLEVSFSTKAIFFFSSVVRLLSDDGDEIISSAETDFVRDNDAFHTLEVSKMSPDCDCGINGARARHKGKACYDYILQLGTDVLQVQLDLKVAWDKTSRAKDISSSAISGPTLSDDLKTFLANQKKSVVITCEGKTFPVPKLLLCARSDVFKAMLTGDTEEAKTGKIEVKEGVTHEVMAIFLHFLATDKVSKEELKEHAIELLALADMYNVKRLKSQSELAVQKGVGAQNCAECLVLADRYGSLGIKKKAISVMKERKQKVLATAGWKKLVQQHPNVALEVLSIL